MKLNPHYQELKSSYLFANIAQKVADFRAANPDRDIIRLGIGDVTLPLCDAVTAAMHRAVDEMAQKDSFRGYGPDDQGYDFLKAAIRGYYAKRGVTLSDAEVFVSDGAKSDIANILDVFDTDNAVLIPDPVYSVYLDTNIMDGRAVSFLDATVENGFLPVPGPEQRADIAYLCSPNNPSGAVYTREMLKAWVDWALNCGAVILFDAAYESFVRDPDLPRSIFEIPGARGCAIEFCSLSKTAGFTGTRCGYTVIPRELEADGHKLADLWLRRQTTKFNGVPYVVQRGAQAVFSDEGQVQVRAQIDYYMRNAETMATALRDKGIWFVGGVNSPYIWLRCPDGLGSWEYFDLLLEQAGVVGTPGAGFGRCGEGFFRLTAFGDQDRTREAVRRILAL